MTRFATVFLAALLGSGAQPAAIAYSADLAVEPSLEVSGICGEDWVLRKITDRFRHQVRNVPHLPDVAITEFYRIHENRYLPSLGEERPIARRYCEANVVLSDGNDRKVWYLIEEGMGFASIGDNVEFCIAGFDRWNVYNSGCRILR